MSEYLGKFGMSEMEQAAEEIMAEYKYWLEYYKNKKKPEEKFTADIRKVNQKVGFVELVYRGWLKKEEYCRNGQFNLTKDFLKRIKEKK